MSGHDIRILPGNAPALSLFVACPWLHGPDGRPTGLDWAQGLAVAHWQDVTPAPPLYHKLRILESTVLRHLTDDADQ